MTTVSSPESIALKNVGFSYEKNHDSTALFDDFSITIPLGAAVAIMGPSGSGKSTLGKLIARMIQPQSGEVAWPHDFRSPHDLVYIDQQPLNSVFPWQSVKQNVEYPLRKLHWPTGEITQRVAFLLKLFRLDHLKSAFPADLSGGELQRLAVVRSLSWKPKCAVLDESFSALDAKIKDTILAEIRRLADTEGMTLILITHNLSDALVMADRCVLLGGRPVNVVTDMTVNLGLPRDEHSVGYRDAQMTLVSAIRDAIL